MIVPTPPEPPDPPRRSVSGHGSGRERAAWLVLAVDGPAVELPTLVPGTVVRVTADPRRFRDILLAERPRIAVVSEPPAGEDVLDAVAGERRRRARLRVVHLSPPDAATARLAALARGFDDVLTTETGSSELAGRLEWLESRVQQRPGAGSPLPVADDLELDLLAHELRRGQATVHLRPKEFGLLALLAGHPGRAYTRRELLQRVWGRDHGSGSRTVDVHIRWLRSKVEPDPEHPVHLVTVRGVGYRLDPGGALTRP